MIGLMLVALLALAACQTPGGKPDSVAASQIDNDADAALPETLHQYARSPVLGEACQGYSSVPRYRQAGFIAGAQYGKGALIRTDGLRGITTLSRVLWPAGWCPVFRLRHVFMTGSALDYLNSSAGFEVGVGPSVVVVDAGIAKSLTTTTAKDDVYAFIFGQKGLMAGLGLQGSKITRINP